MFKAIEISYLLLIFLLAPGVRAAEQAARLTAPLFTIEIAKPWNELEQVIVVNDSARFDEDALSARDVLPAARRETADPG